jgi:SAM-dependent methyltransferase
MIELCEFSVTRGYCPRCGVKRLFVKLNKTEIAVRCFSCRASLITLSLINVMQDVIGDLSSKSVYELSARGPLLGYLEEVCGNLTCSEFFDEVKPGAYKSGILCQDVQKLTFEDRSFDVCTSLEVFEHVPNDFKGFSEIYRVLKHDGIFVFTVPIDMNVKTIERARIDLLGKIEHLTEPEYHLDPLRDYAPILAYRTYGLDIVNKLVAAGFERAEVRSNTLIGLWGAGRPVVVAYKSRTSYNQFKTDPLLLRYATKQRAA